MIAAEIGQVRAGEFRKFSVNERHAQRVRMKCARTPLCELSLPSALSSAKRRSRSIGAPVPRGEGLPSRNRVEALADRWQEQALRIALGEAQGALVRLRGATARGERLDLERLALFSERALGEASQVRFQDLERARVISATERAACHVEQRLLFGEARGRLR